MLVHYYNVHKVLLAHYQPHTHNGIIIVKEMMVYIKIRNVYD